MGTSVDGSWLLSGTRQVASPVTSNQCGGRRGTLIIPQTPRLLDSVRTDPRFYDSPTPRFLKCGIETSVARDDAARSEWSYLPIFFDSSFPQNRRFCDSAPVHRWQYRYADIGCIVGRIDVALKTVGNGYRRDVRVRSCTLSNNS